MTVTIPIADLPNYVGHDLGHSDWLEITQDRVNAFADATNDQQWIHTDPVRAADGPFGGAIAHGFLTLSLGIYFWTDLLEVTGVSAKVNYGLDKVRFISPVKVGAKIRMGAVIASVTEVSGGYQIGVDQTVEIEGEPKPALVSHNLYRFFA
jgi:acyl dehydratase